MSLAHVIVDVFTDTPLQGNQLAVFEDGSALSDDQMQRLAREMNLSETVFLLPAEDGGASTGRSSHPARYAGRAGANGRRMAADREAIDLSVSPSDLLHLPPTDPSAARAANF